MRVSTTASPAEIAAYDAAIKAAPNDPTLRYRRGVLRMTPPADYSGAIQDFNAALTLSPDNLDVLIRRGDAYGRAGDAQKSIADLDRALAAAESGFQVWRKTSAYDRYRLMRKAADLLRGRADDIARITIRTHQAAIRIIDKTGQNQKEE